MLRGEAGGTQERPLAAGDMLTVSGSPQAKFAEQREQFDAEMMEQYLLVRVRTRKRAERARATAECAADDLP